MLGGAIADRKCLLGHNAYWFTVSAPFMGSPVVDKRFVSVKKDKLTCPLTIPASIRLRDDPGYLGNMVNYCIPDTQRRNAAYGAMSSSYRGRDAGGFDKVRDSGNSRAVLPISIKFVQQETQGIPSGGLCGTSASRIGDGTIFSVDTGFIEKRSFLLDNAQTLGLANSNDGFVELSSCQAVSPNGQRGSFESVSDGIPLDANWRRSSPAGQSLPTGCSKIG